MLHKLREFFAGKRVLILGYGKEGQSTHYLLKKYNLAESVEVWQEYRRTDPLPPPGEIDIIMKSPGIPLLKTHAEKDPRITGQADLFLRFCENPVIGVTGTKGKSTTCALLFHILRELGIKRRIAGNIGIPPLDLAHDGEDKLAEGEIVICELSCHQLEYVQASPKIAVLLNIHEEHLDHYIDFEHYKYAKENIFRFQKPGDVLIRGEDVSAEKIDPGRAKLRGKHNIHNIAVAVKTAVAVGADESAAIEAAYSYKGLEHRLELFAEIGGVKWVNDSISTIPAAAIAAADAFPETDALIIGGMDRGIDYSALVEFLNARPDIAVIALPDSGHKIADSLTRPNVRKAKDLPEAVEIARQIARQCCVLSPAAASYGFYKNFEERGRHFKELLAQGFHP